MYKKKSIFSGIHEPVNDLQFYIISLSQQIFIIAAFFFINKSVLLKICYIHQYRMQLYYLPVVTYLYCCIQSYSED